MKDGNGFMGKIGPKGRSGNWKPYKYKSSGKTTLGNSTASFYRCALSKGNKRKFQRFTNNRDPSWQLPEETPA